MNKLELISALKKEANISKSEAARVVQIFFDKTADAMAQGDRASGRRCRRSLSDVSRQAGREVARSGGVAHVRARG